MESGEAKTLRETPGLFWGFYVVLPVAVLIGAVAARLRWDGGLSTAVVSILVGAAIAVLWIAAEAIYDVYWLKVHLWRKPGEPLGRRRPSVTRRPPKPEEDRPPPPPPPPPEVSTSTTAFRDTTAQFNAWLREHEPMMKLVSWMTSLVVFAFVIVDRF